MWEVWEESEAGGKRGRQAGHVITADERHVRSRETSGRHGREARQGERLERRGAASTETRDLGCWPALGRHPSHMRGTPGTPHQGSAGTQHMHARERGRQRAREGRRSEAGRKREAGGKGRECERHGMRDIRMSHLTYSRTEYLHTYTHECRAGECGGKGGEEETKSNGYSRILLFHTHHICSARVRRSDMQGKGKQSARGKESSRQSNAHEERNARDIYALNTSRQRGHTCTHNEKECEGKASAQRSEAVRRKPAATRTAR